MSDGFEYDSIVLQSMHHVDILLHRRILYLYPMTNSCLCELGHKYIGIETKWSPFCRRYMEINFIQWKQSHFDSNLTDIRSWGAIDNKLSLVQVTRHAMIWNYDDIV